MAQQAERDFFFEETFFSLLTKQGDLILEILSFTSRRNEFQYGPTAHPACMQEKSSFSSLLVRFVLIKEGNQYFLPHRIQAVLHPLSPLLVI